MREMGNVGKCEQWCACEWVRAVGRDSAPLWQVLVQRKRFCTHFFRLLQKRCVWLSAHTKCSTPVVLLLLMLLVVCSIFLAATARLDKFCSGFTSHQLLCTGLTFGLNWKRENSGKWKRTEWKMRRRKMFAVLILNNIQQRKSGQVKSVRSFYPPFPRYRFSNGSI